MLWLASRWLAAGSWLRIRRCSWANWRQLSAPNNVGTRSTVAAAREHHALPHIMLWVGERHINVNVRSGQPVTWLGDRRFLWQLPPRQHTEQHRPPWMNLGGSYAVSQQTECLVLAAASYGNLHSILAVCWQHSSMTSSSVFANGESTSVKCTASGSVLQSKTSYWAAGALEGAHVQV